MWHHSDSWPARLGLQESVKKKSLNPTSRSTWVSAGLLARVCMFSHNHNSIRKCIFWFFVNIFVKILFFFTKLQLSSNITSCQNPIAFSSHFSILLYKCVNYMHCAWCVWQLHTDQHRFKLHCLHTELCVIVSVICISLAWEQNLPSDCSSSCSLLSHYFQYMPCLEKIWLGKPAKSVGWCWLWCDIHRYCLLSE